MRYLANTLPPRKVRAVETPLRVLLLLCAAMPVRAAIEANGNLLTVTTDRLVASFRGSDLVGLRNTLTGESYVQAPATSSLLNLDLIQASGEELRSEGWKTGAGDQEQGAVARIVFQDSVRTAWMEVGVDPQSQEVVIRLGGQSKRAGVTGLTWGIAGLELAAGRLVLPAHAGTFIDRSTFQGSVQLDYPTNWEAQMAVFEGGQGSLLVYSRDTQSLFKRLFVAGRGSGTVDVKFRTEAVAPWPQAVDVPVTEWRLNSFRGDWRLPAVVYRQWLESARPSVSSEGARSWARSIRTVVILHSLDAGLLDGLAARLNPAKTLLYLPQWRKDPYDVNYPDYTPNVATKPFVERAHALGFRVMLHTNLVGVSPGNPDYETVRPFQARASHNLGLIGWWWDRPDSVPGRHAFINPASGVYRNLFLSRLRPAIEAIGPDAIHLDVSAPMFNDGNGVIEGMNYAQGSIALHRELLTAFPHIVFGGESINELLAPYTWFAQRWIPSSPSSGAPHPISTYLLGDHVRFYGYLGQPGPDDPRYKSYIQRYEAQGVLPTPVVRDRSDLADDRPGVARLFRQARAWQEHDFLPDWNVDWRGARFRFGGADGSTAVVEDLGNVVRLRVEPETLYQRVHDTSQLETPLFIPGWPAYDAGFLYGLNPQRQYWLETAARPVDMGRLASLPGDVTLGPGTMVSPDFAYYELLPIEVQRFDFLGELWLARPGTTYSGIDGPLVNGATAQAAQMMVGGQRRGTLYAHPPYQGPTGGETFVEYAVAVPAAEVALEFEAGLDERATGSDGVTFRVAVDGDDVWREHVTVGAWRRGSVSLSRYAGRRVRLRFITHPGPALNTAYDWAHWSAIRLVTTGSSNAPELSLVLPGQTEPAGFAGKARFDLQDGGLAISGLALPGSFLVFLKPGKAVQTEQSLVELPYSTWMAGEGELPVPGTVYGSGSLSSVSSGGVTKARALNAHPPQNGQTIICWTVKLPEAEQLKLSFSAGVRDGTSTSGVGFEVRVNGKTLWRWETSQPGWRNQTLDLSDWRGQNVLLQLAADSLGENYYDWAHWADVSLSVEPPVRPTLHP